MKVSKTYNTLYKLKVTIQQQRQQQQQCRQSKEPYRFTKETEHLVDDEKGLGQKSKRKDKITLKT